MTSKEVNLITKKYSCSICSWTRSVSCNFLVSWWTSVLPRGTCPCSVSNIKCPNVIESDAWGIMSAKNPKLIIWKWDSNMLRSWQRSVVSPIGSVRPNLDPIAVLIHKPQSIHVICRLNLTRFRLPKTSKNNVLVTHEGHRVPWSRTRLFSLVIVCPDRGQGCSPLLSTSYQTSGSG